MSKSQSYAEMIVELSRAHYNRHISFDDYRHQRKNILDEVDREYNGVEIPDTNEHDVDEDITKRHPAKAFDPTDTQPNFIK